MLGQAWSHVNDFPVFVEQGVMRHTAFIAAQSNVLLRACALAQSPIVHFSGHRSDWPAGEPIPW